mgnify:CR=1 FL=1
MKTIGLVVPKGSKYGKNPLLKTFLEQNDVVSGFYGAWETPNLSLLTIAGLTPDDYEVHFIDEDHGATVPFDTAYDVVAITGMTQQIYRGYEIADRFRQNGSYIVFGGIHTTIMPDEVAQHADTVMIGEGEDIWLQFLKDYENGSPKARYGSGTYVDMTRSPVPRYDILNKELYKSYSVQTTRGCPRTCNYCTLPRMYGNTFRHKTIGQVLDEVKAIQRFDANSFVFFADDNMFIKKDYSKELLRELATLDILWGTQTDISVAYDDELLTLLYHSGCHWLFIGFENVTQGGLDLLDANQWKAKQLDDYERSIERIHRHGINIWGSFMFGGDNDTLSVFENTLDFTVRNGIYSGSFTIMTPLPGTGLFEKMDQEGRIIDHDWSRYTFWDVIFQPVHMTPDELAKGVAWVYDRFYSKENVMDRAGKIRKRLKQAKELHGPRK